MAEPPTRIIIAPTTTPTLEPVRPQLPPSAAADLSLSANPPLMREGAFISGARAQIVRGRSGRQYAIFDADGLGRRLPPMILSESPHLAAIERALEREPESRFRLFGRVTVYRDRNFLLATAPALIERATPTDDEAQRLAASERAAAAAASSPPAAPSTPRPTSGEDPSIAQIVEELDKAVGTRRPSAGTDAAPAPVGPAAATPVINGADAGVMAGFLTTRRARIVRLADGALAATLDNGTSGRTEGPLLLLPNQNLTALESIVDQLGDATTYTLTGDVQVYKGRRYLLISMYSVNRAADNVMPMQ